MKTDTDMQEFVARGGAKVTLGDLKKLIASLPQIREEAASIDGEEYPGLAEQIEFLGEVLADFHAGNFDALTFGAAAEIAFALQYLQKDIDLIPDFVPEIGLVDDATVVRIVLARQRGILGTHPAAGSIRWE
jgi:uncharacterized membrane protein YkvA (DUF1232 family)